MNIKLFTFPFAGGSSTYYYRWKQSLDDNIKLVPVELAGRGKRQKTPFYESFTEAIEDIYNQIAGEIEEGPYAFFGHSMGCLLAYELSSLIQIRNRVEPISMFMSGRWAPHINRPDLVNTSTSDILLKERLLELGGVTQELFENQNLADTFIPILRADFKLMETYRFKEGRRPSSAAINVMTGVDDKEVNQRDLLEWSQHTNGEFSLHKFKGGHFFINDSYDLVIEHINKTLRLLANR